MGRAAHLVTVLVSAQLAQGDLGLDAAHSALLVGEAVGLRGDVNGDLGRVGQQLVQLLLLATAQPLQRAAVGPVARVALLTVRHRQVLRAERRVRLEAAHAAVGPAGRGWGMGRKGQGMGRKRQGMGRKGRGTKGEMGKLVISVIIHENAHCLF